MIEAEACAGWFAYGEPQSNRLEDTERQRGAVPLAEPPGGNFDWTKESRRRAEIISRYRPPPFVTPLYRELREISSKHRNPDVRQLALEVQTGRYTISELANMVVDAHFRTTKPRQPRRRAKGTRENSPAPPE
jgi:hypothetical protein